MTADEKYSMLNGVGWDEWELREGYHVGTLPGVKRLGVPPLRMQDAGQGFRPYVRRAGMSLMNRGDAAAGRS